MGLAPGDKISGGVSGHRLSTGWGFRLGADNDNGELGNQGGDGADGSEERSQDGTDGSEGHGNLDERVAVFVLHNDALDVALVDQGADLIDEVAAQDVNFFHNIIEIHTVGYVGTCRQVPKRWALGFPGANPGTSMISTCQEKKHFSLHSPEGFEAPG
jgi:hypothetical protein